MMENCLYSIVVLNDASEAEHHPVERPSRHQVLFPYFNATRSTLFYLNSLMDCFFIENHQRCYALGKDTQPNHYFLWKFSSLFNATVFIDISTINCLHSTVLRIIDTINVNELLIRKREFSWFLLFENLFQATLQIFSV